MDKFDIAQFIPSDGRIVQDFKDDSVSVAAVGSHIRHIQKFPDIRCCQDGAWQRFGLPRKLDLLAWVIQEIIHFLQKPGEALGGSQKLSLGP